jgi:hypothetical protein
MIIPQGPGFQTDTELGLSYSALTLIDVLRFDTPSVSGLEPLMTILRAALPGILHR